MAAEKEAFGLYFSAHPTDRYRHLAGAHGARSFVEICAMPAGPSIEPVFVNGKRQPGPTLKMSVLVEEARWRTSARGTRYLLATLSDHSGQFIASCFDADTSTQLEAKGREGACLLISVETDRRPGEDTPRFTVRGVQSFENLTTNARLVLEVETAEPAALGQLAALLDGHGGGRGEARLKALLPDGGRADILLGRGYLLDAELAATIDRIPGVTARLQQAEPLRLALVS